MNTEEERVQGAIQIGEELRLAKLQTEALSLFALNQKWKIQSLKDKNSNLLAQIHALKLQKKTEGTAPEGKDSTDHSTTDMRYPFGDKAASALARLNEELDANKEKEKTPPVRKLEWLKVESIEQLPVGCVVRMPDGVAHTVRCHSYYAFLVGKHVCILALPHEIPPMPEGTP